LSCHFGDLWGHQVHISKSCPSAVGAGGMTRDPERIWAWFDALTWLNPFAAFRDTHWSEIGANVEAGLESPPDSCFVPIVRPEGAP
jgi:hypothetical protein